VIPDVVVDAAKLRVPVFAKGTAARVRVDQLEEYLLLSAFTQGKISEARLELADELHDLELDWSRIPKEEWEPHRVGKTMASIDEAKAVLHPQRWEKIRDLRWQIRVMTDEIDRLERDATKVSRAYTMISGG
jgi:hypothetical protein